VKNDSELNQLKFNIPNILYEKKILFLFLKLHMSNIKKYHYNVISF